MQFSTVKNVVPSVLFAGLLFGALMGCEHPVPFEGEEPGAELEFDVVRVTAGEVNRDIEGLGNLVYCDKATVLSRIDGVVEKIFIKKGDRVKRGDLIVQLSNFQLELEKIKTEKEVLTAEEELETARMQYIDEEKSLHRKFLQLEKLWLEKRNYEAEIEFLTDNFTRKKTLFEKGGITEEQLRSLEFALRSKERELDIVKKDYELQSHGFRNEDLRTEGYNVPDDEEERRKMIIFINTKISRKRIGFSEIRLKKMLVELERINWLMKHTEIRAPIDGVVTEVLKFVGEKVGADEAVTTLLNYDRLIARASFSESEMLRINHGDGVKIFIDALEKEIEGKIHTIDPYVDVKTRSFFVDCLVENTVNLVPGMFIRIKIPVKKVENTLFVPKDAIISESMNQGYVYIVVKDDRIFKRSVDYEDIDGDRVIVKNGLREGDMIILNPLLNLMDGMKINHREI
jgi:multidrug efflux pump subunit AcrA (membrane-fusion protein)